MNTRLMGIFLDKRRRNLHKSCMAQQVAELAILRPMVQNLVSELGSPTKVARAAGWDVQRPDQAVKAIVDGTAIEIKIAFADWVLAQTTYAEGPLARAMADLRAAGLNEAQLQRIAGELAIMNLPAQTSAPTPASTSAAPSLEPGKSGPLRLEPEEARAFLDWILGQVETMPSERPLTKACRVVARRVALDNAPEASGGTSGGSPPATDTPGKGAPSAGAPAGPRGRRKKDP